MSFTGPRIIAGRRPLCIFTLTGVTSRQGPSYGAGAAALTLATTATGRKVSRAGGAATIELAGSGASRSVLRGAGAVALALAGVGAGRRVCRGSGATALGLAATAAARDWFEQGKLADFAAIADFNRDRYAMTTVPLGSIPTASVAELCVKRACSFAEWFAFVASSTTARSYSDASGILRNDLATDQPRFDWLNGRRQLGLNAQSANLLLNSATGTTQSVTVTAVAHTLAFTGTGTVVLSGVSTAGPLVGTGATNRVNLGFTPTAGSLTLTMTGDVRLVQLEAQALASPYIPTAGAAVTRAIETAELSPTLEAILQRSAASVVVRGQNLLRAQGMMLGVTGGNALLRSATGRTTVVIDGSSSLVSGGGPSFETNIWAAASAFDATGRSVVRNGGTVTIDAGAPPATRAAAYLGRNGSGTLYGDGWYDFVGIAPSRLSDARLTELAVPA